MVVETSRKHFPYLCEGLNDSRAEIIYRDGKEFIEEDGEKYDVIILDLSDPIGPAADLFQKAFQQKVCDRLSDDGILVAQTESPFYNKRTVRAIHGNLREVFPIARLFTCFMPIYPSGLWCFAFCSRKRDPLSDFDQERYDRLNLSTRYYNAETHRAAFALPQFVKELVTQK